MRDLFTRIWFWIDDNIVKAILSAIILVIVVVVLWPLSVIQIPAGHVGVLWSRFFGGTDLSRVYAEGTRVILPWDTMTMYDTRFQLRTEDYDVLSVDGLRSKVTVAFRYRAHAEHANLLHKLVGPDYVSILLSKDIASQARHVFARYKPEEAFTTQRAVIEADIFQAARHDLKKDFAEADVGRPQLVDLNKVMVVGIEFPQSVAESIERKSEEFHRAQQYVFRLEVERREAERKEIEAMGIRTFQDIVKDGLTDHYLRWRGIEATMALAQSPNAKMVVMGSGPTGLPILLGNMADGPTAAAGDAANTSTVTTAPQRTEPRLVGGTAATLPRTTTAPVTDNKAEPPMTAIPPTPAAVPPAAK
jgi:regulator of protease activity HflC (stomatin/prohibitin superfamily)